MGTGGDITSKLAEISLALEQPKPKPKTNKSKAVRLAEAAKVLEAANSKYQWKFQEVQRAQQKLDELRKALTERSMDVLEAEEAVEAPKHHLWLIVARATACTLALVRAE